MSRHIVWRSAITGRYVTQAYVATHPDTTVAETVGPVRALIAKLTARNPKDRP